MAAPGSIDISVNDSESDDSGNCSELPVRRNRPQSSAIARHARRFGGGDAGRSRRGVSIAWLSFPPPPPGLARGRTVSPFLPRGRRRRAACKAPA
jgi:hypothetical protein